MRSDRCARVGHADGLHDLFGCGHADVGRDQRFFECLLGLDVEQAARGVSVQPTLHEPRRTLLCPRERLFDLVEKTHSPIPLSSFQSPVASPHVRRKPPAPIARARRGKPATPNPNPESRIPSPNLQTNLRFELGALRASHKGLDRVSWGTSALEDSRHLGGDRQLDPVLRAELQRSAGRAHTFGDHVKVPEHLVEAAAAAKLDTDMTIATEVSGARQHEIAKATEARQRVAPPALRACKAGDFDEAARDERGHRVVAETEALDRACGDRNHILERAADFDPGDIVAAHTVASLAPELLLDP